MKLLDSKSIVHPVVARLIPVTRFWERAISSVEPDSACLRNFISEFDAYTSAVISEMEDHRTKRVRNVEDYLALRRDTCGVASTLSIIEFGLDLPADVLRHPIVASLTEGAVKLIGIINVRCSINFVNSPCLILF